MQWVLWDVDECRHTEQLIWEPSHRSYSSFSVCPVLNTALAGSRAVAFCLAVGVRYEDLHVPWHIVQVLWSWLPSKSFSCMAAFPLKLLVLHLSFFAGCISLSVFFHLFFCLVVFPLPKYVFRLCLFYHRHIPVIEVHLYSVLNK